MGQITITGSTVDEVINLAMSMKNAAVAKPETRSVPEASAAAPKTVPSAGGPKVPPSVAPKTVPSAGVPKAPPTAAPKAPTVPSRVPTKKKGFDIEVVRANQNKVMQLEGGKAFVKETLGVFGANKLTELDPELLEEYNDALEAFGGEEEEEENFD